MIYINLFSINCIYTFTTEFCG